MPAPGPIEPTKLVPIPTSNGNLHGEAFVPAGTPKGIADGPADYYLDSPAAARWLGAGASRLGLSGAVEPVALQRLLAGAHPDDGAMLVSGKAAAPGRTPGYDLTFSPPKSVTLLAVFSDPQVGDAGPRRRTAGRWRTPWG